MVMMTTLVLQAVHHKLSLEALCTAISCYFCNLLVMVLLSGLQERAEVARLKRALSEATAAGEREYLDLEQQLAESERARAAACHRANQLEQELQLQLQLQQEGERGQASQEASQIQELQQQLQQVRQQLAEQQQRQQTCSQEAPAQDSRIQEVCSFDVLQINWQCCLCIVTVMMLLLSKG